MTRLLPPLLSTLPTFSDNATTDDQKKKTMLRSRLPSNLMIIMDNTPKTISMFLRILGVGHCPSWVLDDIWVVFGPDMSHVWGVFVNWGVVVSVEFEEVFCVPM